MVDDYVKKGKALYCYGAGEYGRVVKLYLDGLGVEINGFIVSDKGDKDVVQVLSVPVYEPSEIPDSWEDCQVILSLEESLHGIVSKTVMGYGCSEIYPVSCTEIAKMRMKIHPDRIDRSGVLVLLYHRIVDLPYDEWNIAVSPSLFESEMEYLHNNYTVIGLNDDWDSAGERSIVVTFDDGYVDNYQNAYPILKRFGIPATFYICTGNIGTGREFWWDELESIVSSSNRDKVVWKGVEIILDCTENRSMACQTLHSILKESHPDEREKMLEDIAATMDVNSIPRWNYRSVNEAELLEMASVPYLNIGAHTVTHSCMAELSSDDIIWEISESKRILEKMIGRNIVDFSYPFGSVDDRGRWIDEILGSNGFQTISTTSGGVVRNGNRGKAEIPRNSVKSSITNVDGFARFLDITYAMSDGVYV